MLTPDLINFIKWPSVSIPRLPRVVVQHLLSDFGHRIHHFFPSTLPLTLILPTHGGMARLSWPGWLITYKDGATQLEPAMVTHTNTNRTRCRITTLIETMALPLLVCQTTTNTITSQWQLQCKSPVKCCYYYYYYYYYHKITQYTCKEKKQWRKI